MILSISTSSALVSVALFDGHGALIESKEGMSERNSSEILFGFLSQMELTGVTGIVVDSGPGGFTSVRIGLTAAKILGSEWNVNVACLPAFRFISPESDAFVASTKGKVMMEDGIEVPVEQAIGIGYSRDGGVYPHANRIAKLLSELQWQSPLEITANYVNEPSISQPKDARILGQGVQ